MLGTLLFVLCRSFPECVVSGVSVTSVLFSYIGFGQRASPMSVAPMVHRCTAWMATWVGRPFGPISTFSAAAHAGRSNTPPGDNNVSKKQTTVPVPARHETVAHIIQYNLPRQTPRERESQPTSDSPHDGREVNRRRANHDGSMRLERVNETQF